MQIRVAPSLGSLEGHPHDAWGTSDYNNVFDPAVFMGVYGFRDFFELWNHKNKRYVFWCGSDITHLLTGYWLDDKGEHRLPVQEIARWINNNCESWVENLAEWNALKGVGIHAKICPSFMGNVNDYQVEYKHSYTPKVYASVSGNDFKLYGWEAIARVAQVHPEIEFHLYGNTVPWSCNLKNVIIHGRVPKEQMNAEIKTMQAGLRLLPFDGFSEIIAKSVLWGQWPIAHIAYPHVLNIDSLKDLRLQFEPNIAGREYYLKTLNRFPWNTKL